MVSPCKKLHYFGTRLFYKPCKQRATQKHYTKQTYCVKRVCRELISKGLLQSNPFDGVKFKKVRATSKLPSSANQVKQLREWMKINDKQMLLITEMLYYLYLRPAELLQLKIGDILFDDGKVIVSGNIVKDDDVIYKKIPQPFKPQIAELQKVNTHYYIIGYNQKPGTKPICYRNLATRHRKMLDACNISNRYSLYSWVHTGCKNAALTNIPIKELQLQKGHHDLNMFNEYLKG